MEPNDFLEIIIPGTVITMSPISVKPNNQKIRFVKHLNFSNVPVAMILHEGEINHPEISINIDKKELIKVLEFLTK